MNMSELITDCCGKPESECRCDEAYQPKPCRFSPDNQVMCNKLNPDYFDCRQCLSKKYPKKELK